MESPDGSLPRFTHDHRRRRNAGGDAPVVFLGKAFADRLPMKAIHYAASSLFLILGAVFLFRALWR
jgi:hypothetical protein